MKEEIVEMTIPYHGLEDVVESMATCLQTPIRNIKKKETF